MVCAVMANMWMPPAARRVNAFDFIPKFETPERRPQTPEEQLNFMLMIQKIQNAGQA